MKWHLSGWVLMVAILAAGCGGGDKPADTTEPESPSPEAGTGEEPTAGPTFPQDKATATISGRVQYVGDPPPQKPIADETVAASDKFCAKHHADDPILAEDLIVSSDGAIQNVLVYIKKFPEDWTHAVPAQTVVLDQKNCTYVPHVFGVMVGQTVKVTSSDATAHNVNLIQRRNPEVKMNAAMNEGGSAEIEFKRKELGSAYFKCDIHGWMKSWVGIFEHPFHAVTGRDGSYQLGKLPPGEYTVAAWHETLGKQEEVVTLEDGETLTVEFKFEPTE